MADTVRAFSLRFSERPPVHYASLADAIFNIDSMAWVSGPLSLCFNEHALAEGKELLELLGK